MDLVHLWRAGGIWMYPLLLLGMIGLAGTLVFAILAITSERGSSRTLILSMVLCAYGLLVFATGAIGWQASIAQVEQAVANVNPADRELIIAEGTSEARVITMFGTAACLPPLVVGVAMFGLGIARLRRYTGPQLEVAASKR